jgi:predicted ArsR family transcriptional regulator
LWIKLIWTTKHIWCNQEFEIITLITPRSKAEEKALQEIVSRYISVVNEEAGSPQLQQSKIFEGLYALCRMACERQVSATTNSVLCNKALEILAFGHEASTIAAADLYSILISGFEMGR